MARHADREGAAVPEEPDERLDLTGITREHRQPAAAAPRWLRVGVVVLGVALLVPAVVSGRWWVASWWACCSCVSALHLWRPFRPVLVRVDEDALHVRRGLRLRRVPWSDVTQVLVQGRWDDASTAVLRDGQRLPLPGVPREDAERLAAALAPRRPEASRPRGPAPRRAVPLSASGPVSPEGFPWEGPFHRGPGR